MRVSSNENCAQWRWATAPALLPAGAGWVVGMVWEYGWQERESKRAEESTQMSQVHAVSQAVRPMSLADSGDPGGPRPGQQRRGRWGEEVQVFHRLEHGHGR